MRKTAVGGGLREGLVLSDSITERLGCYTTEHHNWATI